MTEQGFPRGSAFVFLDEIRDNFLKDFSLNDIKKAGAHSLKSFEKNLIKKMKHYNSNKENIDNVLQLENGVRSYSTEIIEANGEFSYLIIELLESRGGKINIIVKKAENLRNESVSYFNSSRKVNKAVKCNKTIMFIVTVIIVLVILIL